MFFKEIVRELYLIHCSNAIELAFISIFSIYFAFVIFLKIEIFFNVIVYLSFFESGSDLDLYKYLINRQEYSYWQYLCYNKHLQYHT